jgi:hypothetical protein
MVVVHSSHAISTTAILWQDRYYYPTLQKRGARNEKLQSRLKSDGHAHLRWCEQLITHKFPHCAPANLETSCLLEICDVSRKLRLRCSFQFLPYYARLKLYLKMGVHWESGLKWLVIFTSILWRKNVRVWTALSWVRIWASGGILWKSKCTYVRKNVWNLLTSWANISFSRKIVSWC